MSEELEKKESLEEKEESEGGMSEFIKECKDKGMSDEDIAGTAFVMFGKEELSKGELLAILEEVGMELSEEHADMSEEELRENVSKVLEVEPEEKVEEKEEVEVEEPSEDDKKKSAFELAGL